MSEENKAIIRRYGEQVINQGRLDLFEELIADDVIPHSSPGITDAESMKQTIAMRRNAFPDIQGTADDLIAEEDKVVVRWTLSGTHQGEFHGIPATGKRVSWSGISIYRLAGAKIVEYWVQADNSGLMQQLGAVPDPGR